MDTQTIVIAIVSFVLGAGVGRFSGRERRKVVWTEPPRQRSSAVYDTSEPNEEIVGLIRAGKKIHAIRRHRELYGTGLKEAKDAIDALDVKLRLTS